MAPVVLIACGRIDFATVGESGDSVDDGGVDTVVANGLVAWYPFDVFTGASTPDATGNGHDADCDSGCPPSVPGIVGGAASFSGSTNPLRVPASPAFDTVGPLTVAMWIAPEMTTGGGCFVNKQLGTSSDNSWQACIAPNLTVFYFTDHPAGADSQYSTTSLTAGTWSHIAISWDGTTKSLFIDGVRDKTGDAELAFDNNGITIGADLDSGAVVAHYLGAMDDLRIYDRALAESEVMQLATPEP